MVGVVGVNCFINFIKFCMNFAAMVSKGMETGLSGTTAEGDQAQAGEGDSDASTVILRKSSIIEHLSFYLYECN